MSDEDQKAALVLQKSFRGHQARSNNLSSKARWEQLLSDTHGVTNERDTEQGKNDPENRWHRALHASSKISNEDSLGDNNEDKDPSDGPLEIKEKTLEESYWLEMVDGRHRYGANLKYYHAKWEDSDTPDNFFKWLDHGAGKDEDLPELPRERLEKERIQYLTVEQRINYLCRFNRQTGKLLWHVSGEPVDTSPNTWEDRGDGQGIVRQEDHPSSDDDPSNSRPPPPSSSPSSTSLSSDSSLEENEATHYAGGTVEPGLKGKVKHFFKSISTTRGIGERMLRKTVKKNTWIFVADMDYNLFVGLKKTGVFQHSSFLSGGKVTAAGILTVQDGLVKSISPLSGHYKISIGHYKSFLTHLEEMGADLSQVKTSKAEMTLLGLEKYGKISKKRKALKHHLLHPQATKREDAKSTYEHSTPDERQQQDEDEEEPKKGKGSKPGARPSRTADIGTFKKELWAGRNRSDGDGSTGKKQGEDRPEPEEPREKPSSSSSSTSSDRDRPSDDVSEPPANNLQSLNLGRTL